MLSTYPPGLGAPGNSGIPEPQNEVPFPLIQKNCPLAGESVPEVSCRGEDGHVDYSSVSAAALYHMEVSSSCLSCELPPSPAFLVQDCLLIHMVCLLSPAK